MKKQTAESGNVLFYVLIAVALLAALIYAVSQSGRGSTQAVNDEKAKLIASELIEYANTVATAVAQLRLRGVKESELCFDDAGWGGANYNHAGCADDANKIFHLAGGGITWKLAPEIAMDKAATPDNLWHIYGDNEVKEVGTTCGTAGCADLILVVNELSAAVCNKLDIALKIIPEGGSIPTDGEIATTRYVGVFDSNKEIGDEAGGDALVGKTAACFLETGNSKYTFYKVLIAR